jgi:hypothetical protein
MLLALAPTLMGPLMARSRMRIQVIFGPGRHVDAAEDVAGVAAGGRVVQAILRAI